jgi:hypothetical protein
MNKPGVVICPKCGKKSSITNLFCPSCGSPLRKFQKRLPGDSTTEPPLPNGDTTPDAPFGEDMAIDEPPPDKEN